MIQTLSLRGTLVSPLEIGAYRPVVVAARIHRTRREASLHKHLHHVPLDRDPIVAPNPGRRRAAYPLARTSMRPFWTRTSNTGCG